MAFAHVASASVKQHLRLESPLLCVTEGAQLSEGAIYLRERLVGFGKPEAGACRLTGSGFPDRGGELLTEKKTKQMKN